MTMQDILRAIDRLTPDELRQLRDYIEQQQHQIAQIEITQLDRALEALREGLTSEQLDQLEWAMNVETLTPTDRSAWQE